MPAAGTDEDAGDVGLGEEPGNRHLGEGLAARFRDGGECADAMKFFFGDVFGTQESVRFAGAGVGIDAVVVASGQQPLGEGAERNATDAFFLQDLG